MGLSHFRLDDSVRIGAVTIEFDRRSAYRALRRVFVASVLMCLFIGGFTATKYLLNPDVVAAHRQAASSASVASVAAENSSNLLSRSGSSVAADHVRALEGRAGTPSRAVSTSEIPTSSTPSVPEWLERLNYYRRLAKVAALSEDTALDDAEVSHASYLVMNYSDYFRAGRIPGGRAMHSEDPAKRWYTFAGQIAAEQSDLYEGCGLGIAQRETVDGWIEGPFHRLSLLSPNVRAAAYGSFQGTAGCGASGLRLVAREQTSWNTPVEFPSDGSQDSLNQIATNEWPNLLASCPGYSSAAGLPITIAFGYGETPTVTQTTVAVNSQPLEHCLVDAKNYENPDPEARASGRRILMSFGALVLVPRHPLTFGSYVVQIGGNRTHYEWSFRVD